MMFTWGLLLGVALYAAWAARNLSFRVEEGHAAIVTRFGAAHRKPDGKLKVYGPGLHLKWSFEEVHPVSMRELLIKLSGDKGPEPLMLNDGTIIRVDAMLRYAPREDGLEHYVFGLRHRREHMRGLFSCILRNEIANVKAPPVHGTDLTVQDGGGSYALVRRDRIMLNDRISEFARDQLAHRYGAHFFAVDLTDILPPDELAEALNAVMSAEAEAETARFHAESECAQQVMAAERGVPIARARAAAVEAEILELGTHLARLKEQGVLDDYVARRRAEVMADARTLYLSGQGAAR